MHRKDRAAKAGLRLVVSVVCGATLPVAFFYLGTTGIFLTKKIAGAIVSYIGNG